MIEHTLFLILTPMGTPPCPRRLEPVAFCVQECWFTMEHTFTLREHLGLDWRNAMSRYGYPGDANACAAAQ